MGVQKEAIFIIRYNGKLAIALGVSNITDGNVVVIGKTVDQKILDAKSRRPLGMEVSTYYNPVQVVEASVDNFVINVLAALIIVILFILTIACHLANHEFNKYSYASNFHRIALGVMVDNAIVVTEGILVSVQRGVKKIEIAKKIVNQTQWPLLGGTLVGIIVFAPIGFASGQTAEYTNALFWVILITLLFSWVFAISITPLSCYLLFSEPSKHTKANKDSVFYRHYKKKCKVCATL